MWQAKYCMWCLVIMFSVLNPAITAGQDTAIPELSSAIETVKLEAPSQLIAGDVDNDDGGVIHVSWKSPVDPKPDHFVVEMAGQDGIWEKVTETVLEDYDVMGVPNFTPLSFRVAAVYGDRTIRSDEISGIIAKDHWMKLGKVPVLVAILIFISLLMFFIVSARLGRELFVRRITGMSAVEDAIGRATEMGRPVLYVPGTSYIEDVATLAALNILGEVARRTVHYDVKIIVPNIDPIVFAIAREIVKETYNSEGRPDAFDPNSVFFMVPEQFAYAAGVNGIMVREKPATIFFMGWFAAESLIMAETGASTGAVQIAGTDDLGQLPFFITACDYTLIGEELYAASAYLGNEPILLGTLKTQDYSKLVFIIVMVILTALGLMMPEWNVISWIQVR